MTHATLTVEPYVGRDNARHLILDCPHGTTACVVVCESGAAPPITQIVILLCITLELDEGCGCAEAIFNCYAPQFAAERGIPFPPFTELRAGVAEWMASMVGGGV